MASAENRLGLWPIGFVLGVLLCPSPACAVGDFIWAGALGGASDEVAYAVLVDDSGSVYTTGSFEGTVDFDPGPGIANLSAVGLDDIFVSKLDSSGGFVWAKSIGSAASDSGFGLALDGSGNLYVSGAFAGTADFDPGPGVFNLGVAYWDDVFVLKLDSSGDFLWAKTVGNVGRDDGMDIAADASGNVYTVGSFEGTVDFDPGPGIANLSAVAATDIFVLKLDSSGDFVWAKTMGSIGTDFGMGVAVDASGNVHASGVFAATADFDPGPGISNLSSAGRWDVFLLKLDSSGNFVWAGAVGGPGIEATYDVAVDASGNVYATGSFVATADFDPGAGRFSLSAAGGEDIFVLKLDASGNFVWAKAIGGTGTDEGMGIAVDALENVHTTGYFSGTVDFKPGPGRYDLTSAGGDDAFVLKLDASGDFVWARTMGGTSGDQGSRIALDASSNVHTVGQFQDTIDVDPGTGTVNLVSAGGNDVFVLKLSPTGPGVSMASPVADPTNISTIPVTVTFTSPVTGFDAGDITTRRSSVANFAGSGASYTFDLMPSVEGVVTADIPPGVAEEIPTNDTNAGASQFRRTYDITPPPVSIGAPSAARTNTGPVLYTVTYADAVSVTLATGDVTIIGGGTAAGTASVSGSGASTRTVALSGIGGDGTLSISIGVGTASDAAGNAAVGAGPSASFVVDNTPPTLSIGPPSSFTTTGLPVSYLVTYTGAESVSLGAGDVILNATGTATGSVRVLSSGATRSPVVISGLGGNGTLGISIAPGTAVDDVGNGAAGAGPSATFTVVSAPLPIPTVPAANLLALVLSLLLLAGLGCFALRRN